MSVKLKEAPDLLDAHGSRLRVHNNVGDNAVRAMKAYTLNSAMVIVRSMAFRRRRKNPVGELAHRLLAGECRERIHRETMLIGSTSRVPERCAR